MGGKLHWSHAYNFHMSSYFLCELKEVAIHKHGLGSVAGLSWTFFHKYTYTYSQYVILYLHNMYHLMLIVYYLTFIATHFSQEYEKIM